MKILPPVLAPWRAAIERRHSPPERRGRTGYRSYRSCLRWEFGFTCPFCLCHEADFAPRGAEGLGVTQIEHFILASQDDTAIYVYSNCFYICRFCNRSRSATPNVDPTDDRRLLNPCWDVWAEYFSVADDELKARGRSKEATYTLDVYNLNDSRKVVRRGFRRQTIEECLDLIYRGGAIVARLLEKATAEQDPDLVDEARAIEDAVRRAWLDLYVFQVVPQDAPRSCACGRDESCSIAHLLEEQTLEVEPPSIDPSGIRRSAEPPLDGA